MHLRKLLSRVPAELALLNAAYEKEAPRHDPLALYPTLASLVDRLKPKGSPSTEERKALITCLIRVHQTAPHRVWSTVLLQVFAPLLRKIRKKLHGADGETRDEILLEEFQHALLGVRTDDPRRIVMYVRQALRRRTFKALNGVRAWEEVGFGTDADLEPDPRTLEEPQLLGVWLKGFGPRPEQAELLATFPSMIFTHEASGFPSSLSWAAKISFCLSMCCAGTSSLWTTCGLIAATCIAQFSMKALKRHGLVMLSVVGCCRTVWKS